MILEGSVVGFIARLVPEVFGFFNAKDERKSELERLRLEADIAKERSEAALKTGEQNMKLAEIQALIEAVKGQSRITGNKFADGVNAMVRPMYAYVCLVMLCLHSFGIVVMGDMMQSVTGSVVAFFFLDRSLAKLGR